MISGQVLAHGGFAAGELHGRDRDGFLVTEELQHPDDFIKGRFIDKPAGTGIGKTEIAVKVAAVREIDIGKQGLRMVVIAQAAGGRAVFGRSSILGIWRYRTLPHRTVRTGDRGPHLTSRGYGNFRAAGMYVFSQIFPSSSTISASIAERHVGQRLRVFFISISVSTRRLSCSGLSGLSNLNVCACSLLQVLECYIISIDFIIIPLAFRGLDHASRISPESRCCTLRGRHSR